MQSLSTYITLVSLSNIFGKSHYKGNVYHYHFQDIVAWRYYHLLSGVHGAKGLNLKSLQSSYFALLYPYVNYANITGASTNNTYLKPILGKQK